MDLIQTQSEKSLNKVFRDINDKGERKYNIEKLITFLNEKEGKGLVSSLCDVIKEPRRDLLEHTLTIIGKEHFLNLVEKALAAQNEGGIKKKINNEIKTVGGVLFKLIKKDAGLNKESIKEIFKVDYQGRNQRKKLMNKINKLQI